ncbi:DMT family transporter [Salinisphaera aquimarina]|uniref:Guanidinium exporter n=1 Tax=Salinisphaera aquimarina TaxID=2094031 RepID=A0ABV7ELI3_9GAMM
MNWLLLIAAGGFEIVGVAGFERLTRHRYATGLMLGISGFALGLTCLRLAMDTIPMAIAYGVFTGIGAVGSTLVGMAFWGDSARPARLACIAMIIIAVVGLKNTL